VIGSGQEITMTKMRRNGSVDFGDEEAVLREVAEALGEDADSLSIEDSHMTSFREGLVYEISTRGGRRSWLVMEDEDQAEALAVAVVRQDLESEPELFSRDFLEQHIDTDRLRRDLTSDVESMTYEDLTEEAERRPEHFWTQAEQYGTGSASFIVSWDNGHATGDLAGRFDDEDDAIEAGEAWKAEMVAADPEEAEDVYSYEVSIKEPSTSEIEDLAEKIAEDRLRDPIAYLEEIYGREDGIQQAIQIGGIDIAAAAQDAVNIDGWPHFLCRYDGNYEETPSGFVVWREN